MVEESVDGFDEGAAGVGREGDGEFWVGEGAEELLVGGSAIGGEAVGIVSEEEFWFG